MLSDTSSSSGHYKVNKTRNSIRPSSNGQEAEPDDRQNSVGGYVDDLMERIRKMPPKKRSKFYQLLDEERLKDVNNNHPSSQLKSVSDEDEETHSRHELVIDEDEQDDDEEDRTLIEMLPKGKMNNIEKTSRNKSKKYSMNDFSTFNEQQYEELRSMGVPLNVLKALVYQQETNNDRSKTHRTTNEEEQRFLNARTILRHILQQKEDEEETKHFQTEPMECFLDSSTIDDERLISRRNGNSSLSPQTSSSSSPDQVDLHHRSKTPNSLSRPSSTPTTLVTSGCLF